MKYLVAIFLLLIYAFSSAQTVNDSLVEWQVRIHKEGFNRLTGIVQTNEQDYIVCGYSTILFNGNKNASTVIKISKTGEIIWQKELADTINNYANDICLSGDTTIIITGKSNMHGQNASLGGDYWIMKLDMDGNEIWKKTYGGSDREESNSIISTSDNGCILAGYASSNDGDVTGFKGNPFSSADFWIVKLDADGNLDWQKCLGGSSWDEANDIVQTNDGSFVVVGRSASKDSDILKNLGSFDVCVFKIDSAGKILWQKNLGGEGWDEGTDVINAEQNFVISSLCGTTSDLSSKKERRFFILDSLGNEISDLSIDTNMPDVYPYSFKERELNNGMFELCIYHEIGAKDIADNICFTLMEDPQTEVIQPTIDGGLVAGITAFENSDGDMMIIKLKSLR